jgi:hypothetical protein
MERMNEAAPKIGGRGTDVLLRHCRALTEGVERAPAYCRLEELVDDELAKFLLIALAGRRGDPLAA